MSQGKNTSRSRTVDLVNAWKTGGERGLTEACILKCLMVLDGTDSGRDTKPLMSQTFELVDRLKALDAEEAACRPETALGRVLKVVGE
jgi:hypothetical protein